MTNGPQSNETKIQWNKRGRARLTQRQSLTKKRKLWISVLVLWPGPRRKFIIKPFCLVTDELQNQPNVDQNMKNCKKLIEKIRRQI